MSFKLKKEENAFQVMREGKFEYRRYEHGKPYDEVPPEDAHRFEKTNNTNDRHE
jgi:hypothetical protein